MRSATTWAAATATFSCRTQVRSCTTIPPDTTSSHTIMATTIRTTLSWRMTTPGRGATRWRCRTSRRPTIHTAACRLAMKCMTTCRLFTAPSPLPRGGGLSPPRASAALVLRQCWWWSIPTASRWAGRRAATMCSRPARKSRSGQRRTVATRLPDGPWTASRFPATATSAWRRTPMWPRESRSSSRHASSRPRRTR